MSGKVLEAEVPAVAKQMFAAITLMVATQRTAMVAHCGFLVREIK
jgi:hypothetical protein